MKAYSILRDQSGAALVMALMMMVTLTLIGISSTLTATVENKLSGGKRGSTSAFYASESGVQVAVANVANFDLSEKYVGNKYDPFTDSNNTNPTKAKVVIEHVVDQGGAPRGFGISATQLEFEYFLIDSTGQDQIDLSLLRPTCTIREKVVRLVPTLQGGY